MIGNEKLTFILDDDFIDQYAEAPVEWGFAADNGMSVGEFTFLRTYSRPISKETGRAWNSEGKLPEGDDIDGKEKWYQTIRRVVEGSYSVQKNHCLYHQIPWDEEKAQKSAQEMYTLMFNFKMWAPGRGLANMGMPFSLENSAWLFNCSFVSTENIDVDPITPFTTLMDFSLVGIGVGFDTRGAGKARVWQPEGTFPYAIPDSREGWVKSIELLLKAYLLEGHRKPVFDYSKIRPEGSPIRTTGGVAPGPEPLITAHKTLIRIFEELPIGEKVDSRLIVDIANIIGKAVVSGGKRRTALLALGNYEDREFSALKDWRLEKNKERMEQGKGWAHTSNNSLIVRNNTDVDYTWLVDQQLLNGEPGIFNQDLIAHYGRLVDGFQSGVDLYAIGTNPCGEISLEHGEVCNLVSVDPNRHYTVYDFMRSLKFAYLYSKSITLMSTHNANTNSVQLRNRRIGTSVSGLAEFVDSRGWGQLKTWLDTGYSEVRRWDEIYSKWLGVRESIKVTTVKPEGSAALLSGSIPGVHFPTGKTYIRRIRVNKNNPLIPLLQEANYTIEPDSQDPTTTLVIEFPVKDERPVRKEADVSVYEKLGLYVLAQEYWADNSVSCTLSFDPETEVKDTVNALQMHGDKIKSLSFLPLFSSTHPQKPYEEITEERYEREVAKLKEVDLAKVYLEGKFQASDDKFCSGDSCEVLV